MTKGQFIGYERAVLSACKVEVTREFEGQTLQRFTGHICRVSGAQWLHNLGVPLQFLQILGRWSCLTILKYLQTAPLQVLPETAANALMRGPAGGAGTDPLVLVQPDAGAEVFIEDSDDDAADRPQAVPDRRRKKRRTAGASGQQAVRPRASAASTDSLRSPGTPFLTWAPPLASAASQEEVSQLRTEVATMQAALDDLRGKESYIIQGRSRKHHRIAVSEVANVPTSWTTVCGWRYGLGQFYRANMIAVSVFLSFTIGHRVPIVSPFPARASLAPTTLVRPGRSPVEFGR